jgi:hypothetical protein
MPNLTSLFKGLTKEDHKEVLDQGLQVVSLILRFVKSFTVEG